MSSQVLQMESYILPTGGAEWNSNIIEKVRTYQWRILKVYSEILDAPEKNKQQFLRREVGSGHSVAETLALYLGLEEILRFENLGGGGGVRNWLKTQPFLALLSSKKRQQWKCRCIASCVGQVARCSSYLLGEESERCPVTRWASKASRTPRLADWGWALSHKKNEKKTDILRNPGRFSWRFHFMGCNTHNWTRHEQLHNLKTMPQASYKMVLGRLLLWFWLLNVTRQFLLWPCKSSF